MEPEIKVHNWSQKLKVWKHAWFKPLFGWIAFLLLGIVAINYVQTTLIDAREAVLFSNTYVSTQPFGPKIDTLNYKPVRLWLNYQAEVPKDCAIIFNGVIRHKFAGSDKVQISSIGDSRVELSVPPTADGEKRSVAWLLTFRDSDAFFTVPGQYEIVRTARFQCGNSPTNSLTGTQKATFNVR